MSLARKVAGWGGILQNWYREFMYVGKEVVCCGSLSAVCVKGNPNIHVLFLVICQVHESDVRRSIKHLIRRVVEKACQVWINRVDGKTFKKHAVFIVWLRSIIN